MSHDLVRATVAIYTRQSPGGGGVCGFTISVSFILIEIGIWNNIACYAKIIKSLPDMFSYTAK